MKKLEKKSIEEILPLTPMQAGMLFHHLKDPASNAYFEQLCLGLRGEIDFENFEAAWRRVVETNEMLRALFRWETGREPVQIILKETGFCPAYHDLTATPSPRTPLSLEEIKRRDRLEGFDLRQVPFRVTLCKRAAAVYDMIISHHHILFDGWSSGIILQEFLRAYEAICRRRLVEKPEKPRFKMFVQRVCTGDSGEQARFWSDYLESAPAAALPAIPPAEAQPAGESRYYRFRLGEARVKRLAALGRAQKITVAAFLYTAWGILLQKYNDRQDVIFDTTVAGRSVDLKGIGNLVGLCINTLPLRIRTAHGETVAACAQRTGLHLREREAHENTPITVLNEWLETLDRHYLFDSVMVVENYPLDRRYLQKQGILQVTDYSIVEETHRDVTVIVNLSGGIDIALTVKPGLPDRLAVGRLPDHFLKVVDSMLTRPGQRPGEIELFSGKERPRLKRMPGHSRHPSRVGEGKTIAPPLTGTEKRLAEIWSRVLRRDIAAIGCGNDFFAFGGHSLKAAMLASEVHREFNVRLPLAVVFDRPTLRHMADYIASGTKERYRPLQAVEKREYYAAASAQKRFYMLQQLEPESTAYNVSTVLAVTGKLDRERLEDAFERLIRRHESLRTAFRLVNGEPAQIIHEPVDFRIEYFVSREREPEKRESEAGGGIPAAHDPLVRTFIRPFNLERPPLLRVGLIHRQKSNFDAVDPLAAGENYLLMVDLHHIVTDAVSMDLLIREFGYLYGGRELPAVTFRYKDYCRWQERRLASGGLKVAETFWLQQLSGELPRLELATDFPRPPVRSFAGERIYFNLDKTLTRRLRLLIRQTGTSLFMVLLAALNALLYRYTGQEDILVGTTVAGREHRDTGGIIGLFIETLAIRSRPAGDRRFGDFLQEIRAECLHAFQHQGYPFGELLMRMGRERLSDLSMNPLFNVMLIVQNVEMSGLEVEGLSFGTLEYHSQAAKVDITLEAVEGPGEVRCHLEYGSRLFRRKTMQRFAAHYVGALREICRNPAVCLGEIGIMDEEERRRSREFGRAKTQYFPGEDGRTVAEIFERQAVHSPDHIAVGCGKSGSGGPLLISYRELHGRVKELAKMIEEL